MEIIHRRAFIDYLKKRIDMLMAERKKVGEDDPTYYVLTGQLIECREQIAHLQENIHAVN